MPFVPQRVFFEAGSLDYGFVTKYTDVDSLLNHSSPFGQQDISLNYSRHPFFPKQTHIASLLLVQ